MTTLRSVLSSIIPDATTLGDEGRSIDRGRLIAVLDGLASDLQRAYWIRLGAGVVILAILLFFTVRMADQPATLTALVGGMGVTVAGTTTMLQKVTEEMSRVRLLLAIAPELSLEALTEMARKIVEKI